jgi:membrane associated rhomboid family serine protease
MRNLPLATSITNFICNADPFNYYNNDDNTISDYSSSSSNNTDSDYFCNYCNLSNHIILFINFFFFFYYMDKENNSLEDVNTSDRSLYFFAYSHYPFCENKKHEFWKLITYSFVHSGISHLLGNTLIIYVSTMLISHSQSFFNLLTLYYSSIVNSALYYYIIKPYGTCIGCSGGSYAMAGSNISNLIFNYDNMSVIEFNSNVFFLFTFCLSDIISFFNFYKNNVAYQVHWTSLLYGILYGLSFFKIKNKNKFKKNLKTLSIFLMCYYNSILLFNYLFNSPPIFKLNYFKLQYPDDCCFQLENHNGDSTFYCDFSENSSVNFI